MTRALSSAVGRACLPATNITALGLHWANLNGSPSCRFCDEIRLICSKARRRPRPRSFGGYKTMVSHDNEADSYDDALSTDDDDEDSTSNESEDEDSDESGDEDEEEDLVRELFATRSIPRLALTKQLYTTKNGDEQLVEAASTRHSKHVCHQLTRPLWRFFHHNGVRNVRRFALEEATHDEELIAGTSATGRVLVGVHIRTREL